MVGGSRGSSLKQATTDFENVRKYKNPLREMIILKDSPIEFIFIVHDGISPDIVIHGHFLDIEEKVKTKVIMEVDVPGGIDNDDIEKAKNRFNAFTKCAHSITGWKNVPVLSEVKEEKNNLVLRGYQPYFEPQEGNPWRAGDLVATLTDENGKRASGKLIYFYVKLDTNLGKVLEHRSADTLVDDADVFNYFISPTTGGSYIGHGYTNERGYASTNYISCFKPEKFSEIAIKTDGTIKGKITAVVFNSKTKKIGQKASTYIEIPSVARITNIKSLNKDDAMVRIVPVGSKTGNLMQKVLPNQLPYELLCGDVVLLDESDLIDIHWLTGIKMRIQPKIDFLKKNQLAKVHIEGKDAGWVRTMSSDFANPFLGLILGGSGFYVGTIHTVTGEIIGIPGMFMIGLSIGEYIWEPLIIQFYSTILIDFDENATVYTVEGTGRLHNIKDYSTDVTTGHKMSVSPDGTFSQVTKFDRSELSDDLSYFLESIEKDESDKQSKLEISKLYVGKSVYPRGTEVDVYFDVKNIGTVDVDEYHVECRINDLKGNEMYKFVGSAHSIASGKQQKFVAAEKWKIPSDARIGPYIIDCALIWGSKRDTAGREFFVTHPAKREDRTAELEISNLYTGKSEYLKGAGERVDVCYYVKNTGTVDISEYHVIYQIFDSEGKRYCWFISDMFGSIVAGKEDKWQSGVWNVPSDAKVGRYTVDAMVIWGLDRFSRETAYFFVK